MNIHVQFTLVDTDGNEIHKFEMLGPLVLWGPYENATYCVRIDGRFQVARVISYDGPKVLGPELAEAKTVIQLQVA
jgi:hypothetical protein